METVGVEYLGAAIGAGVAEDEDALLATLRRPERATLSGLRVLYIECGVVRWEAGSLARMAASNVFMSGIGGITGAEGALPDAARARPGVGIAERAGIPDVRGLPGVVAMIVVRCQVKQQESPDPDLSPGGVGRESLKA